MNGQRVLIPLLFAVGLGTTAWGQDTAPAPPSTPPSPGWHKFGERDSGAQAPVDNQGIPVQTPPPAQPPAPQQPVGPLSINSGTWITVRMNQALSTDRNQPGDAFTATLVQPLVVNGLVVARRGQTVGGRVVSSTKAGRVKGTSELGVELTELSLVDGQQIPLRTQLMERRGDTSVGTDAAAIGTTTGVGAAIGAAAAGGWGAGLGAIAGAVVSTTGVLVTRGRPTVIYPETVLTFRIEQPITIQPRSDYAFQPASQADYDQPGMRTRTSGPPRYGAAGYPAYPAYPAYPVYPYYGYGYGYPYLGTSFFFYGGPHHYYRRW